MATIPSVQLFRNSEIITGRQAAIDALKDQKASVPDGGLILARYSIDGEDNNVKTLLGIVRNSGSGNADLTIIDVEGTAENVQSAITSAINGISGTTEITNGQVITAISQTAGIVSVTAATLGAENVSASEITDDGTKVDVTGTNVAAQISSLATSIKTVSAAAKTYSIAVISGDDLTALGTNVREAYKLVDEDGAQTGETIKIYKDSSLKEVALNGQTLNFTYILADGNESTVGVDVSVFLAESEFKNGLEVVDHVVNVKKDASSEDFLSVSESGVKLDGVQAAINTAAASAKTKVEKASDATHITVTPTTSDVDGSVTYTIGESDIASATDLAKEIQDRQNAISGISGTTTITNGQVITAISQTAGIVSVTAATLGAENVSASTIDDDGTKVAVTGGNVAAQISSLAKSIKSASTAAAAAHTEVEAKTDGHVRVSVAKSSDNTHNVVTITENDIASANALTAETSSRQSQDDRIEAAVGLNADGNHVKTNGHYTKDATTVVGEIAALDRQLKAVSDTLGTGVSTAEGKTVTEQLRALSGTTGDASGVTSVEGAKAYAKDLVENLDADVESTTESTLETTTTKAIRIKQTDGKIASITLGAFDCGVY